MLPLRILAAGIGVAAAGISQLLPEGEGPNIYEKMVEWGLEPSVESLGYNAGDGIQLRLTRFAPAFIEGAVSVIQSPGAAYVAFGATTEDRMTDAGAKFRRLTEAQFWGVGVDSREDDKSNYEWEQIQLGGIWEAKVSDHLTFNSAAGWETNRTGLGHNDNLPDIREAFDPDSLYGSLDVVNYVIAGTQATVDFTHIDILQPRGVRFIGEAFYYGGTGSTDSDFLRLQGEVQGYIPFNQRQSFALRTLVETNPGWGQGVPFYYFAELGGDRDLRGFTTARFRDRDRLTWTVEWRYEAWRELQDRSRAEWFVFWDSGTVMPSISEITSFRNDWGFGLRFATQTGPGAHFSFAWGDEGFRFGFRLISDF
jgi:outer membrane protein assembly factor BamA